MREEPGSLIFNVIYVRNTVEKLLPFVLSLADYSEFRFRLVSNGCKDEEEALLARCAARHSQLEYVSLNTSRVLLHGDALQQLFCTTDQEFFALIDSDIFARGRFFQDLAHQLDTHDACFSGLPYWHRPSDLCMPVEFDIMGGRYVYDHKGLCLGVSYCAIYRRRALAEVIQQHQLTFIRRTWSQVPVAFQAILRELELKKVLYDTGKLLNIALAYHQRSSALIRDSSLVHIGAISIRSTVRHRPQTRLRAWTKRVLPDAMVDWIRKSLLVDRRVSSAERIDMLQLAERRRLADEYLTWLLEDGGPLEGGPIADLAPQHKQELIRIGVALLDVKACYPALP